MTDQARHTLQISEEEADGLRQWLPYLNDLEQKVVTARFGLTGELPLPIGKVALSLGISAPRASVAMKKAGERIRLERAPSKSPSDTRLSQKEIEEKLQFLPLLTEIEKEVFTARYGLDGSKPKTAAEVAISRKIDKSTVYETLQRVEERIRCGTSLVTPSSIGSDATPSLSVDELCGLEQWLPHLSTQEQKAVSLRYGLRGNGARSVEEVARSMGTDTFTTYRLLSKAGQRIRLEVQPASQPEPLSDGEADGLKAWLPFLSEQEQQVVIARYGLDGKPPLCATEIAETFGMKNARVANALRIAGERIRLERAPCKSSSNKFRSETEREGLKAWLPFLPEVEAEIVKARFGLSGSEPMSIGEIAATRKVSDRAVAAALLRAGERIRMERPPSQLHGEIVDAAEGHSPDAASASGLCL